jgi:hypothetical protein
MRTLRHQEESGLDSPTSSKSARTRHRRSEDELINDLQKKIEALKQRKETRQLKGDQNIKRAIAAHRALVRAERLCGEAGHVKLANALKAAHLALRPHVNAGEE